MRAGWCCTTDDCTSMIEVKVTTMTETPRDTPPRMQAPALKTTVPSLVNLIALSARFSSAARRRSASPATIAGRSGASAISVLMPLLPARAISATPTASARRRGENGSCCKVRPAASALTASTIHVVSAAR